MNKGVLSAIAAYVLWAFFPIYWKQLDAPAQEVLAHRMVWSQLFMVGLLTYQGHWKWLRPVLRDRRMMFFVGMAALLLSANWGIFLWAVSEGYVVDASLGYFITPLVNVMMGMVFFREKLRSGQWIALVLATSGVLYLTWSYGQLPWVAIILAFSFSIYGLLKKMSKLESREGLTLETGFMFFPALAYLIYLQMNGVATFGRLPLSTAYLIGAGVVTATPLLLFAYGAQRIKLSTLGLLQYIAPTGQFLIGVFLYNEAFNTQRIIGFAIVWAALVIYSAESFHNYRRDATAPQVN